MKSSVAFRLLLTALCATVVALAAAAGATAATFSWSAPQLVDSGSGPALSSLTCPTSTECVALDGAGRSVAFAPGSSAAGHRLTLSPGAVTTGLACTTGDSCVATLLNGDALIFDPSSSDSDPQTARVTIDPA